MQPRRLSTGVAYTPLGSMQHRVTILQDIQNRDPEGEFGPPSDFADVWASISLLQGRDLEKAQHIVAEVTHKVVVRYMEGLDSGMLIQFGDRLFQIEAVQDPDERKVELHLLSRERNDGRPGEQ